MKIAMIGVISNPVTSDKSHNGGWTLVLKNYLENYFNTEIIIEKDFKKFNFYDKIIINEGVNYKEGVYNFFGGVTEDTKNKIISLSKYQGDLFIVNDNLCFYDLFNKRKELNEFINLKMPTIKVINTINQFDKKIIVGDSHSISVYKPGYGISRNDGKTLFSFLRNHNNDRYYTKRDDVITYFGNIDIRFHLPRQENPIKATENLAIEYVNWCWKTKAKPVCLLPIESEDRKIPGTGKYKGQNFYGTRQLRRSLVKIFNNILQSHFLDCYVWPEHWYDDDYDFTKEMELKQSVHLRPTSYMNYNILNNTKTNLQNKLF